MLVHDVDAEAGLLANDDADGVAVAKRHSNFDENADSDADAVGQSDPMMVTTIHGEMDAALLEKREGVVDDEIERTKWIEYWLDGELVHRSAHVTLKKAVVFAEAEAADLNRR